jgi:hypothetical protein
MNRKRKLLHRGLHYRRLRFGNPREAAFVAEWEKENEPLTGIGTRGVLQALMVLEEPKPRRGYWRCLGPLYLHWRRVPFIIRRRDAVIAATVIQWLGSNIGMDFLACALRRCGYEIVKIKEPAGRTPGELLVTK